MGEEEAVVLVPVEESDTSGVVRAEEGAKEMMAPSEGRHGSVAVDIWLVMELVLMERMMVI